MNIGSMIRGLLGDSKAGEPKSLELKEGQVVRGVVLSVSDSGKEAVVQIQGLPVRAELETPLQAGQTLNMQVSPPGENGLPVLKPVSLEVTVASPQSMGEALESLGLTNAKDGPEIIKAMQSAGLPLTKETAAQLNAVMSAKPQGVPAEQWLQAAVISVKRGLPVTAESVKGLHQAVFGPGLTQLLSALEEQVTVWASQLKTAGGMGSGTGGVATNQNTSGGAAKLNLNSDEAAAMSAGTADDGINESGQAGTAGRAGTAATGSNSTQAQQGMAQGTLRAGDTAGNAVGTAGTAGAAGNAAGTAGAGGAAGNAAGAGDVAGNAAGAAGAGSAAGNAAGAAGTGGAAGNEAGAVGTGGAAGNAAGTAGTGGAAGNAAGTAGAGGAAGNAAGTAGAGGAAGNAAGAAGAGGAAGNAAGAGGATGNAAGAASTGGAAGNAAGTGASGNAAGAAGAGGVAGNAAGAAGAGGAAGNAAGVAGTGGAAGNAGAAGVGSPAASGTALLAKLQGVLTELRGSLPQLSAVPHADAAGPGAPAAG
ncbi:hypothetical protein, partial [Paenibacillus sp. sgz500958]|uniref:hypothetical protein n=1 Tax=Paenibacillus sp. sgz500958 TaxID=3242475 RepID=UPI0036D29BA0